MSYWLSDLCIDADDDDGDDDDDDGEYDDVLTDWFIDWCWWYGIDGLCECTSDWLVGRWMNDWVIYWVSVLLSYLFIDWCIEWWLIDWMIGDWLLDWWINVW